MKTYKTVTIYLPHGAEIIYTTSKEAAKGDRTWTVATSISIVGQQVEIQYLQDKELHTETYVNLPFFVETWFVID